MRIRITEKNYIKWFYRFTFCCRSRARINDKVTLLLRMQKNYQKLSIKPEVR